MAFVNRCCVFITVAFVWAVFLGSSEVALATKYRRSTREFADRCADNDPSSSRGENESNRPVDEKCPRVIAMTRKGRYQGHVQEVLHAKVATFLGMRYAEAPVGEKRFKKPIPAKQWNGTRDALRYSNTCYQWRDNSFGEGYPGTEMWNPNTPLSEDCLFLNVWSPLPFGFLRGTMPTNAALFPVMVWIFGGGFYSGTSSLDVYDGSWLAATQKVVVVSMNYRVAALGFLTFGTTEAPGNAGLWDQNLALQWVRENIQFFQGDPSRVTLFGESAGAASIGMHILSNHSNTLFQGAIMQSASILSPWAVLSMPIMQKRARDLAKKLGCDASSGEEEDHAEIATCMYSTDAQKIVDVEIGMEDLGTARFQNAAVFDQDFITSEVFEQLEVGNFVTNINILAGFTRDEGNYFLIYSTEGFNDISNNGRITYSQFHNGLVRGLWGYPGQAVNAKAAAKNHTSNVTLDAIEFEYSNFEAALEDREQCTTLNSELVCVNADSKNDYKAILDDIIGDINFICPVIDFFEKSKSDQEDGAKQFLYKFLHRSSQTPWPEWMGTLHGYEIEFVFGIPLNQALNYTEEERTLSRLMMEYWTNFAKSGDPNYSLEKSEAVSGTQELELTEWPTYNEEKEVILVFGIEHGNNPEAVAYIKEKMTKHCRFWNHYYPSLQKNLQGLKACNTDSSQMRSVSTWWFLLFCSVLASNLVSS